MRDHELYARILGVTHPWRVERVELGDGEVIQHERKALCCPECQTKSPGYDTRRRRWRHLDTCQYRTILEAEVPRVKCSEHGVRQVSVPWAEPGSRFTALFEALAIDWLQEASLTAVARLLGLTWHEIDGIRSRAVARGLARREARPVKHLSVDETSFQKRHEYVTVVIDQDEGNVLFVGDDRREQTLYDFYGDLTIEQIEAIESVAMDMWQPYIQATIKGLPNGEELIAFDKFHVAKHLGDAVDKVRREEHRALKAEGDASLSGTRYAWLVNPDRMTDAQRTWLEALKKCSLKTARAWALREFAMRLWNYRTRGWARRAWKRWLAWAVRSRLEPIKRVARMVKRHLEGILNAVVLKRTTAKSEGINSRIQWIKKMAAGFRNRDRFREAIYFHLGGLDLYPAALRGGVATHTKA